MVNPMRWIILCMIGSAVSGCAGRAVSVRQLTFNEREHFTGPYNPWSPDNQWVVYTCGPNHLNETVERVHVQSGRIETLYSLTNQTLFGPGCGTASYCRAKGKIVFIHGPRNAAEDRTYELWRRSAALVNDADPGSPVFLDARDVTIPFTEGALRGGTHCHQFNQAGDTVAFTYNDMLVSRELRTVGVSRAGTPVAVDEHAENHSGSWFSVLLVPVTEHPEPGSGELSRAYENCWVERRDGATYIAFKGDHVCADGSPLTDLYLVHVPDVFEAQCPERPLSGTETKLPYPPKGAVIRKLTDFSCAGSPVLTRTPRFWLTASQDGSRLYFLARDSKQINQVYSVSTEEGGIRQITFHDRDVTSTVSVHPSGSQIAYVCDGSLFTTGLDSLQSRRLTRKKEYAPEMPAWSHGNQIVFRSRRAAGAPGQLFLIEIASRTAKEERTE